MFYLSGWQIPLDGQSAQPHPQPDLPAFFCLRRPISAPATARATTASTKRVPPFSAKNPAIAHTFPAPTRAGFAAGRNSRYPTPASRASATTVNGLNATVPVKIPPNWYTMRETT